MSKLVAISFSLLMLFQSISIDMDDLIQLDELVEHSQFHKEQYGDNFFVFVSKHYGELKAEHNQKHQDEQDDHDELPFSHHSCTHHVTTAYIGAIFGIPLDKTEPQVSRTNQFFYQLPSGTLFPSGIFQPPKHA